MEKKTTQGGSRPGAGRPALSEKYTEKRVKIYDKHLIVLKQKGLDKSISTYLNALIEKDLTAQ